MEKQTGTLEKYVKDVREQLKFMAYAPVLFISAKTGQRTQRVLDSVRSVYAEATRRVTTGVLNDVMADAQAALQPPATSGRRLKIYYATQQGVQPPRSCFCQRYGADALFLRALSGKPVPQVVRI